MRQELPQVGGTVTRVADLGIEVSELVRRVLPHDGYMLVGLDPISGAACMLAKRGCYTPRAFRELEDKTPLGQNQRTFASLLNSPTPVGVIIPGANTGPHPHQLCEVMTREGFGSEMRISLTHNGGLRGVLVLLREQSRAPFTATEVAYAEFLADPLTRALRGFVTRTALGSFPTEAPPAVLIVNSDNTITAATPNSRDALGAVHPKRLRAVDEARLSDRELFSSIWNITYMARRSGGLAVSRIPTPKGWMALHAQPLIAKEAGQVAVTVQPASPAMLLPTICAWYGISPREQAVIEQALEGLSAKQIARRLGVSPYTVNDHFKSIYRKTGVGSREELLSGLSR